MKLHQTTSGTLLQDGDRWWRLAEPVGRLIQRDDLVAHLQSDAARTEAAAGPNPADLLAPMGEQEVWAAGVTYFKSRTARMEESEDAGGADFYDRVYEADRPELFFKATASRVVAPGGSMHLRRDSKWIVPEPELTVVVTPGGRMVGFTIGNDLSCRDIEGENPLYLPQAKVFDRCAAIGPAILIADTPPGNDTEVRIEIRRQGQAVFEGHTDLGQMKKKPAGLVEYLFRDNVFPNGCFLMTGTGIVPPNDFTLEAGDVVRITIEPIGTLENTMD